MKQVSSPSLIHQTGSIAHWMMMMKMGNLGPEALALLALH